MTKISYKKLLQIQEERLKVSLAAEKESGKSEPETGRILASIMKLKDKLQEEEDSKIELSMERKDEIMDII